MRTLWLALLLFVLIRGLTDTEPFDLSLPLWAVVMLSSLIEYEKTRGESKICDDLAAKFDEQLSSGFRPVAQY